MKVELKQITVRDLTKGYQDNDDDGIKGYGGNLDIRPPYQREFVYKKKQRDAVIDTLKKGFPLNIMYWAVRDDGSYEVLDGQQRTISICRYVEGEFAVKDHIEELYFHNLQNDKQEKILDYKLMVYLCSGTNSEKLEWFETVNIAGEKLTEQELRNAVYHGPWLAEAKKRFSKRDCAAYDIGSKYLAGSPIRQEYLETAIKWITPDTIGKYMGRNQYEPNANELWENFQAVINWVEATFTKYRTPMKGVDWGFLYNKFKSNDFNAKELEEEIEKLINDDDVIKKSGIYFYVLTREEKYLNIRNFNDSQKQSAYGRQKGICAICKNKFGIKEMEADHITPWHEGGKTIPQNCQLLCKECNRRKSGK